jgi:hypothetical protein
MNCVNHPEVPPIAYCRTCGNALCANCKRDVRGVIYCENCLAARLAGTPANATGPQPAYNAAMPATGPMPVNPGGGPYPVVAGVLAGFFPFGVGPVYCGQYVKGLVYLFVFVSLIWGLSSGGSGSLAAVLGIALGFFYVYQIIDSVRTARAIQLAQPVPDPLGLTSMFSPGQKIDANKVPTGAIVLIILGILFLLHTMDLLHFGVDRYWSLILIFLGLWLGAKRLGMGGFVREGACQCERCRMRSLMGPAILLTLGVTFLLDSIDAISFGRTWPALLIVIGLIKILQSNVSNAGHIDVPAANPNTAPVSAIVPASPETQPPASEVHNG